MESFSLVNVLLYNDNKFNIYILGLVSEFVYQVYLWFRLSLGESSQIIILVSFLKTLKWATFYGVARSLAYRKMAQD